MTNRFTYKAKAAIARKQKAAANSASLARVYGPMAGHHANLETAILYQVISAREAREARAMMGVSA